MNSARPGLVFRAPLRGSVALVVLGVAVTAAFWAYAVPCPASYEYAEGDTATWIWLLRHGIDIYRQSEGLPMWRTNYPPLYMSLVGWLAPSDAGILLTGRLLSLFGFALTLAMIGASVAVATGKRSISLLAVGLAALTLRGGLWGAICRADALALGLGAAGVTLAALRVRGWPLWSAVAFAASLLAKHNLVVFPIGVALWALYADRQRGIALVLLTGLLVGLCLYSGRLVDALLWNSVASWHLRGLGDSLVGYVLPALPGLCLSILLLHKWSALPDKARQVLGPWTAVFLCGLLWLPSLGRTGSAFNYVLELFAATTVLAVSAFRYQQASWLLFAYAAAAFIETGVHCAQLALRDVPTYAAEQQAAHHALADVAGQVLAEQSWYATSTGHPPVIIPFLATQLAARGRWDSAPLLAAIRQGEISRVLLGFPITNPLTDHRDQSHRDRLPQGLLAELVQRYVLQKHVGTLYIYRPR